jgi:hypothetical protein
VDDVAHPKGIVEVPRHILHALSTGQVLVVSVVVGVWVCAKVGVSIDDGGGQSSRESRHEERAAGRVVWVLLLTLQHVRRRLMCGPRCRSAHGGCDGAANAGGTRRVAFGYEESGVWFRFMFVSGSDLGLCLHMSCVCICLKTS